MYPCRQFCRDIGGFLRRRCPPASHATPLTTSPWWAHTLALSLPHTQTRSLSYKHTHTRCLSHTPSRSLSHKNTHSLSLSHTHTHTDTRSLSYTHTRANAPCLTLCLSLALPLSSSSSLFLSLHFSLSSHLTPWSPPLSNSTQGYLTCKRMHLPRTLPSAYT